MNTPILATSIWHDTFILSDSEQPSRLQDFRPTDTDYGALDPQTLNAIEVDALFDAINHTQTHIGKLNLYRTLVRPMSDTQILQQKQAAVRELESNPDMCQALQQFIENRAVGEAPLYHLLYGEFKGGLATVTPASGSNKLEFGGYGYYQYIDGTRFAVEMVEATNALPRPQTAYLYELLNTICKFGQSRTYALMHGPVYPVSGKFKTQKEKPRFWPTLRFQPTRFKWLPMLIFIAAISGIVAFFIRFFPNLQHHTLATAYLR